MASKIAVLGSARWASECVLAEKRGPRRVWLRRCRRPQWNVFVAGRRSRSGHARRSRDGRAHVVSVVVSGAQTEAVLFAGRRLQAR